MSVHSLPSPCLGQTTYSLRGKVESALARPWPVVYLAISSLTVRERPRTCASIVTQLVTHPIWTQ